MSQNRGERYAVLIMGWFAVILGFMGVALCLKVLGMVKELKLVELPAASAERLVQHMVRFPGYELALKHPDPISRYHAIRASIVPIPVRGLLSSLLTLGFGLGLLSRKGKGRKLSMALLWVLFLWNLFEIPILLAQGAPAPRVVLNRIIALIGGPFLVWYLTRPDVKRVFG